MTSPRSIFCLESTWGPHGDLIDRFNVTHQLRMLESADYCGKVIHHDVATCKEFDLYLKEWLKKKYSVRYPLGYLAFHGARGALMVVDTTLSLADLSALIGRDKARGRNLYFGGLYWGYSSDDCPDCGCCWPCFLSISKLRLRSAHRPKFSRVACRADSDPSVPPRSHLDRVHT